MLILPYVVRTKGLTGMLHNGKYKHKRSTWDTAAFTTIIITTGTKKGAQGPLCINDLTRKGFIGADGHSVHRPFFISYGGVR
jgi:hypothetical protein